ncbi:hypothetical protein TSMEX_001523 [Taenia solium]|eukprot:TsM_001178900 transcript=TsM_001178900 gene=TsM_001178900
MVAHLSPWLPTEKAVSVKEAEDAGCEEGEKKVESTTTSFLSLAGLNLDLVLENGARLYSADLREFAKDKPSPSKRARRTSNYTDGKAKEDALSSASNVDVLLDRREMNRQLGLEGQAGAFICNLLESNPATSISSLISEADLADNDETISSGSEENDTTATSTNVMTQGPHRSEIGSKLASDERLQYWLLQRAGVVGFPTEANPDDGIPGLPSGGDFEESVKQAYKNARHSK